jgi:hypothetical protein
MIKCNNKLIITKTFQDPRSQKILEGVLYNQQERMYMFGALFSKMHLQCDIH